MKNTCFNPAIFLFLFFFITSFGQDISTLDEKNGFKIFKIKEDKKIYTNDLNILDAKTDVSTYKYIKRDDALFDLFGNKINNINLTFDNKTNKLIKINLDISKNYSVNYLTQLGWYLKNLYYNFEEIIGPTTQTKKPGFDCKNPNQTCLYFEDKIFDGKILWEGQNIVLKIVHKTSYDINPNGNVALKVINEVIFTDKDFDLIERNSGF